MAEPQEAPAAMPPATSAAPRAAVDTEGVDRQQIFTFFQELAEPVRKLGATAWASRGKLARDVRAYIVLLTTAVCSMPGRASKVVNNPKLRELLAEEEDPQALAGVLCGFSGALCIGSAGAVIGATAGGAVGTMVGTVPAIFTLGLSIPIGAIIGGAGGLAVGGTVGSSAGFAGGATSGCGVAYFRHEIMSFTLYVGSKVYDVYDVVIVRPVAAVKSTTKKVREKVHDSAVVTKEKAAAVGDGIKELAADRRVQVSAATAGAGAATLGTAGAATGILVGGTTGALVGLVPALFTFGLSIPIGAVIGGTTGLCVGGATGTTVGFVGGGAAGFTGYTFRHVPGQFMEFTGEKARGTLAAANLIKPVKVD